LLRRGKGFCVSALWGRRARTTWSGIFRWCRRRKNRGEGVRGGNDGGLGPFETLERSISYLLGGLLEMRGDRSCLSEMEDLGCCSRGKRRWRLFCPRYVVCGEGDVCVTTGIANAPRRAAICNDVRWGAGDQRATAIGFARVGGNSAG
jgi:hypothetical protein